uniref:Mitochondrial carrier protein n=2 Tax=Phaeomonas parva TaxID=124430 RepID=A0A7S1UGC6_9STRA|mmetsp:Transcript_43692/g.137193  ORF Transcript_43692/g.137193 Transcript_43692/m.137193 type:complete len:283 (+) Transcript_43692:205-1053(+)|eukprot:CAMPEP_0118876816 /NCGR_PEP_ID=MMETSP1163-20130328/17353_1 /TAXON_ID=124430 /ORGANISM="Phaeomonas parva, Strain CCMP2877" /LENGTH=282 /DNA_ID=CAMNT_0006812457 /DNA_START=64 /DNA_END=912 /DNA_ORIENTATION=+
MAAAAAASPHTSKKRPLPYLLSSSLAAVVNFPLWKASAIGQSGFKVKSHGGAATTALNLYLEALKPPYKGVGVVVFGMTWARAAIFFGSDLGRQQLKERRLVRSELLASALPPLVTSTVVQVCNQPIIRASITLQDPQTQYDNTLAVMRSIARRHGVAALWHGTSAGIMKTVPKYCTAIMAKDYLEDRLPQSDGTRAGALVRSATKAVLAGMAGAIITNPFDVVRNEMFKTNQSLTEVITRLYREEPNFATRGLGKNVVAVSIPVACTIFFTDLFTSALYDA